MTAMLALLQVLMLAANMRIPNGQPAPRLQAMTFEGTSFSGRISGKVTVVDFFATWCPHCRDSLAGYQRLKEARDVRVIIVDTQEDPALVARFFTDRPPPGGVGVLLDPSGAASHAWGVTSYPTAYLIDQNGIIRGSFSGWGEDSARHLAERIDVLQRMAARPRGRKKAAITTGAPSHDERARQLGVEVIR
jgi:thiol-disulfide isomerase/thioredoxin